MMRWILILLLYSLSTATQANKLENNNLNESVQKGLKALSLATTQFLSNIYANKANQDLLSFSDGDRKALFNKEFNITNVECNIVKTQFINFDPKKSAVWGVQCSENKSFIFFISNDAIGTAKFIDCKTCIQWKFTPCLNWCLQTTPRSEANKEPETYYAKPDLANIPDSISALSTDDVKLDQVFHDPTNRYTINYPGTWKQWTDEDTQAFGIPKEPWGILISSPTDNASAIELFKEKPDVAALKKELSNMDSVKNIKFLNHGPLTFKTSDNRSLKGYYITAVYTMYGFWFEIWEVIVERPTAPRYLRFLYISAIALEENTLPIAKAMLKSWLIEP